MDYQNYVFWRVWVSCSLTDNRYLLRFYPEAEQHLSNRILRVKLWKTSYNCEVEILTEISATIRFYTPIESIIVGFKMSRKLTKVSEFNTQRQLWRSWPLVDDQRWLWDWIFWGSPILGDLGMFILGILAESSGLWIFYPRNFSGMGSFFEGWDIKKPHLVYGAVILDMNIISTEVFT